MLEHLFHIDLITFIKSASYFGIFAIVFAESGLLIGAVLPGDSLLFTAGFLASQNYLDIRLLCLIIFIAAVGGDSAGYWIGRKLGPKIFSRPNSLVFDHRNVDRTQAFYDKHGGKTLVLARFMPVVRTFAPIMAGVGKMPYRQFLTYNVIGGFVWGICLPLLAYFLGSVIPNLEHYLSYIILGIVFVSVAPPAWHIFQQWSSGKNNPALEGANSTPSVTEKQ